MKRTIYTLTFMTSSLVTMCQTTTPTGDLYANNIQTTTQSITASGQALNSEYPAFRKNAEQQIADNDKQIADLRMKLGRPGENPRDDVRRQKIDDLEKRNADLRSRLFGYEKSNTDWVAFKRDFNHDMDNLHNAFHDFDNDMKK
jgi:hypothetical protein